MIYYLNGQFPISLQMKSENFRVINKNNPPSQSIRPLRPGGLELTDRLLEKCNFPTTSRLLDVGCGLGLTVDYLNTRGFPAQGIDRIAPISPSCRQGDALSLPLADASQDGVFFECSLSRISDPAKALQEAARVLKNNGRLALADLYARGDPVCGDGLLGTIQSFEVICAQLEEAGFQLLWMEDHSRSLMDTWAKLVFELGPTEAGSILGVDPTSLKAARPGYFLAVFQKKANAQPPILSDWVYSQAHLIKPSPAQFKLWQLEQVRETIALAKSASPFYRDHLAGIAPENLSDLTSLADLPFMDGAILAEQGLRLLCVSQSRVERVRTFQTSGSTGPPKRIWFTAQDLERTVDFFSVGMQHLTAPGDRVAILMSDDTPDSIADLLCRGLARFGANGIIGGHLAWEDLAELAGQAQTIVGLPAEVFYLSRKRPELRPKAVLLSADYIPPALAKGIEAAWQCPVYSHYGLTETGYGLAVQCPQRSLHHLRNADFLVEVIDPRSGRSLLPGQVGELVLTSLEPRAIPLIRYRTGDIGSLVAGCTCGGHLPGLGMISGRWENLRESVNIHDLDDRMYQLDGLDRYQVRRTPEGLALLVEGSVKADAIRSSLGGNVEITFCEEIPRIPGKRRIER